MSNNNLSRNNCVCNSVCFGKHVLHILLAVVAEKTQSHCSHAGSILNTNRHILNASFGVLFEVIVPILLLFQEQIRSFFLDSPSTLLCFIMLTIALILFLSNNSKAFALYNLCHKLICYPIFTNQVPGSSLHSVLVSPWLLNKYCP